MQTDDPTGQTKAMIALRRARAADALAINEIYNHYVLHSNCTYQEEPDPIEQRHRWLSDHDSPAHPVIVAVEHGKVLGWGSLSPFHRRCAYRRTVENSVYVDHAHHRRGIGSMILRELITRATGAGHHAIIALIDGGQTGSVALHARHGFEQVGHLKQVGFKFGQWLDVIYMELILPDSEREAGK